MGLDIDELKELIENSPEVDGDSGFRLICNIGKGYHSDEDVEKANLPYKVIDADPGCHDGQDGQVVIQFNDDPRFFATDHTYSSWDSAYLECNLREVKPREQTITVWDNVKDENT